MKKNKSLNMFFREIGWKMHNFGQNYLEMFEHDPISAIVLPVIIVWSLVNLMKYYFG